MRYDNETYEEMQARLITEAALIARKSGLKNRSGFRVGRDCVPLSHIELGVKRSTVLGGGKLGTDSRPHGVPGISKKGGQQLSATEARERELNLITAQKSWYNQ